MIKEAKVRRAPRATKVTKEAKAPKGNPPLQCYMAAKTRPKEARSKYPCPFWFTSIFTSLHLLLLRILLPRPRWSFRPARSLGSSTCLLKGSPTGHSGPSETLPASTLLSPTFRHFPLVPLYPVGHSGHLGLGSLLSLLQVSHQSFRLVRYRGSSFLLSLHTLHHLSSPFITFHHISSHPITVSPPLYPSFAHLPLPSSPLRIQLVIPAHSVRPSPLLSTSHSHGSQQYLVSHSGSPDTLHPTSFIVGSPSSRVCFQISSRTLMAATCRPDILSNTQ